MCDSLTLVIVTLLESSQAASSSVFSHGTTDGSMCDLAIRVRVMARVRIRIRVRVRVRVRG